MPVQNPSGMGVRIDVVVEYIENASSGADDNNSSTSRVHLSRGICMWTVRVIALNRLNAPVRRHLALKAVMSYQMQD